MINLKTIFFVFVFFCSYSYSQENEEIVYEQDSTGILLNWIPSYDMALEVAKSERKIILIYFKGSDWCGPCKDLDKNLFNTTEFKNLSDNNLVLLEVDIPRNQDLLTPEKISENLYLKNKFKVNSFPTLIFLNHRGKKISEKKGYILTEYYMPYINSIINN